MSASPRPPLLRRVPPVAWMALIWCVFTAYVFLRPPNGPVIPAGALLAMAIVVGAGAPLLRRRPLTALTVLLAGSLAETLAMPSTEVVLLQFLIANIAVYSIAASRPRRVSVAAAAMTLGVVIVYLVVVRGYVGDATELAAASTVVIAWLIGNSRHQSHVHAEDLRARATAQAVTAERLRIARELHDMVAHSIGIIAIQAGVGSRVIDTQPAEARNALQAIEATSRETLSGLRRMLGALRRGGPDSEAEAAPLDPAPGLADLDALAATTLAAGVHVDVQWRGERRSLPADLELSAFRIIQEAVTNVVRHAGTGSCRVSLDCREEELSIEVVDDGCGGLAEGTGYGLVGMRERVGLLNGDLSAGPRPEGGFRVAARLPVPVGTR